VAFLQEVERVTQRPAATTAEPAPATPLPGRLRKLQLTARAKGTAVRFMPPGMKRHETNTSFARLT
jgi:hypothetical protein